MDESPGPGDASDTANAGHPSSVPHCERIGGDVSHSLVRMFAVIAAAGQGSAR